MSFSSGAGFSSVAGAVTAPVTHVVGGLVGDGLSAVFGAAGQWVAAGAVWLLGQVGGAMSASTTVDLSSGWFEAHESVMVAMAATLVLPLVLCATLQALYRQSAAMLVRTFLVQLPLSLLLTGVVVQLVQMALAVTDALSSQVLSGSGTDTNAILAPVSAFLVGAGTVSSVPAFVVFVGGLLVALASLGLWLELVVRAAAVSVAVLFFPLALAAMVWPAVSHWCRRLADTLVALILSKLVIAAVLALAVGALAGGLGRAGPAASAGGFAAVVSGIALLVIATLSPFTLLRLIPALEAGAASHLESTRRQLGSAVKAPLSAGLDIGDIVSRAATAGPAAVAALGSAGDGGTAAAGRTASEGSAASDSTTLATGNGPALSEDKRQQEWPSAPVPPSEFATISGDSGPLARTGARSEARSGGGAPEPEASSALPSAPAPGPSPTDV